MISNGDKIKFVNDSINELLITLDNDIDLVNNIKDYYIPLPSNPELDIKIGEETVRKGYYNIVFLMGEFLEIHKEKIIRDSEANIEELSPEDNQLLDYLFNHVRLKRKQYMHEYVNEMNILSRYYEFIFKEAYKIITNNAFIIDYDINSKLLSYNLYSYRLKEDSTMSIDLNTNKYYWGIGNYQFYDPKAKMITELSVSPYRLRGFDSMIEKYRNSYNYLVGVYYESKSKKRNDLADMQIGISGSFIWYSVNRDDQYAFYIERPECAAQRELYEEGRMFFNLEDIKPELKPDVDNRKEKRLVYSFFVDTKDIQFIDKKTAEEIFKRKDRFIPVDNIFNYFENEFKSSGTDKTNIFKNRGGYYTVKKKGNVFENESIKVSILVAGNDLRHVLNAVYDSEISSNDNIRMISCVGKNIDIKKYVNSKEYRALVNEKINNLSDKEKSDYIFAKKMAILDKY